MSDFCAHFDFFFTSLSLFFLFLSAVCCLFCLSSPLSHIVDSPDDLYDQVGTCLQRACVCLSVSFCVFCVVLCLCGETCPARRKLGASMCPYPCVHATFFVLLHPLVLSMRLLFLLFVPDAPPDPWRGPSTRFSLCTLANLPFFVFFAIALSPLLLLSLVSSLHNTAPASSCPISIFFFQLSLLVSPLPDLHYYPWTDCSFLPCSLCVTFIEGKRKGEPVLVSGCLYVYHHTH